MLRPKLLRSLAAAPSPMVLALCLLPTACDHEDLGDEALVMLDEDDELLIDGDDDSRLACYYNTLTPPSTNDSDTIIGANDEVESTDTADGGCDLHMLRVLASAPSDRARTIDFHATSMLPLDDYGALVWMKGCNGCANFSATAVPLTVSGGGFFCYGPNACVQLPYSLDGQLELSASNTVADIRAGMRAGFDTPSGHLSVHVTITVSE